MYLIGQNIKLQWGKKQQQSSLIGHITITNRLSRNFPLSHLSINCKKWLSSVLCAREPLWMCVCLRVVVWGRSGQRLRLTQKSERKKGKANWYTPLNSGRRKRIGVFMNRISKQQDNQARRKPRLLPPVKTDTRHRFPAPEIVPLRSGLSFYVI